MSDPEDTCGDSLGLNGISEGIGIRTVCNPPFQLSAGRMEDKTETQNEEYAVVVRVAGGMLSFRL